jgi:hypothetical protein
MEIGDKIKIKSEEELFNFLNIQLEGFTTNSETIVTAGHFMLVYDKEQKKLVPGILSASSLKKQASFFGSFPLYTWQLGCEVVNTLKKTNKDSKISLLINDWQLVPVDPDREKSQPNKYRSEFYSNFKKLPPSYEQEMKKYNLDFKKDILKNRNGDFYFKEISLRDRFLRKNKSDRKVGDDTMWNICDLSIDSDNNVILNRKEDGPIPLIIKSKVACAGEVAQMMIDIGLHLKNKNHPKLNFINLMPMMCSTHVNAASELAISFLTSLDKELEISIVNVFFEASNIIDTKDYYESPAVLAFKFSGSSQSQ